MADLGEEVVLNLVIEASTQVTPELRFRLEVRRVGNLQRTPISFTDVRVIHYTCLNSPMVYGEEQCVAITNNNI